MRLFCGFLLASLMAGVAVAQNSYSLTPYGTAPATTPELTLPTPPLQAGATDATQGLSAGADNQTTPPEPAPKADLYPIYYGSEAAPVAVPQNNSSASQSSAVTELQMGIIDTGVGEITSPAALASHGIGVSLAQAAAIAKQRQQHATRVYTNADVEMLHQEDQSQQTNQSEETNQPQQPNQPQ
jgi:hypothetical protein